MLDTDYSWGNSRPLKIPWKFSHTLPHHNGVEVQNRPKEHIKYAESEPNETYHCKCKTMQLTESDGTYRVLDLQDQVAQDNSENEQIHDLLYLRQ